jgi:hypothetical protein
MKLQLWIFFGVNAPQPAPLLDAPSISPVKTAVAQFPLHCAHVIVRLNQRRQRPVPLQFLLARDQAPYAMGT